MLEIIVYGYQGVMGKVLTELIQDNPNTQITAGVDREESKKTHPFPTFSAIDKVDMPGKVLIDFSHPDALEANLNFCMERKIAAVIGTTGFSHEQIEKIKEASKEIPIVFSANMSACINILTLMLEEIAKPLYDMGFDIEIVEKHHNQKIDAPSGTAYYLGDSMKKNLPEDVEYVFDRSQINEKRKKNEIGMSAIRGGTIPGEHEIIFAGLDEIITIKHTSLSKKIFAVGAMEAAEFVYDKKPGLYSMHDVMKEAK